MILNDAPNSSIRWAAVIRGVQEVTLTGMADLAFWRAALRREEFFPYAASGSAEIAISAPRLAWMGLRFCELSVGIWVTRREGAAHPDGLFLAHAFNSSPLLAFSERAFFGTPYQAADVALRHDLPASVTLAQGGRRLLAARMVAPPAFMREGADDWQGPVFLPRAGDGAPRKSFVARLSGTTRAYAFDYASDVLELAPAKPDDIIARLRDSGFVGREWRVRDDGTHARSRTMTG